MTPSSPLNLDVALQVAAALATADWLPPALTDPDRWQNWIHTWLAHLQVDQHPEQRYELTIRLTDDAEIQTLNATYRQMAQPTDVLSFAALETDFPGAAAGWADLPLYLGDIVISLETARHQARDRQHSLTLETVWLAAHGLLHLLGWDHPDETHLQRMVRQQEDMLQMIGFKIQYDRPGE